MKRYTLHYPVGHDCRYKPTMEPYEHGSWVKYKDHLETRAADAERISSLVHAGTELQGALDHALAEVERLRGDLDRMMVERQKCTDCTALAALAQYQTPGRGAEGQALTVRVLAEVERLDVARRKDALRAADAEKKLALLKGEGWPRR